MPTDEYDDLIRSVVKGDTSSDPNREALANPRVRQFLDKIGRSEGADYNTLVGGSRINDLSRHPNKVGLRTVAGPSTAFGKYQIVGSTDRSKLAKYRHLDYSPENQDLRAVELLRQTNALEALEQGDEATAIKRAGREWASLPGSPLPGRKNYAAFKSQQKPVPADDEYSRLISEVLSSEQPSAPPIEQPRGRFTAMADATPIPRHRRAPTGRVEASGLGSVRQLDRSQAKQIDEARVRDMETSRSTGTIPRGVDPRLLKGEQPSDPLAYAKAQELVGRVEPIREVGGIRAGATAMGPRERGVLGRIGEVVDPYLRLDRPAGIKTDPVRGAASLGLLDLRRQITPEEKLIDPDAEYAAGKAYDIGSVVPAVIPYVGAGKVISKIPSLAANTREANIARLALTFGGVELGREYTRAVQTGEPLNPQEVAISTAIGGVTGRIAGVNPSLKRQIVAFVTPGIVADAGRGTDPYDATLTAITNLAFGLHGYKEAPREVKAAAKVASEQLREEVTNEAIRTENEPINIPTATEAPPPVVVRPVGQLPKRTVDATSQVETLGGRRETQTETQPPVRARAAGEKPVARPRAQDEAAADVATPDAAAVAATRLRQPPLESVEAQAAETPVKPQWQHMNFGRVTEADNQSGVGRGRVRVTAEDGSEHVIKRSNLRGEGNNLAVPVREAGAPQVEPDGLLPVPKTFPEGVSSDSAKADYLARQHPQVTTDARAFQELSNRYYEKVSKSVSTEAPTAEAGQKPRNDLVEKIVSSARRGNAQQSIPVQRFEVIGSDGKSYTGALPLGVTAVKRGKEYWVSQTRQGTTVGKRYESRKAWEQANKENLDRRDQEFRDSLSKMSDAELKSQADYWLPKSDVVEFKRPPPLTTTRVATQPTKAAGDAKNRAELKRLQGLRFKTANQERMIELLKERVAADPAKWKVGDGVGWKVGPRGHGGQINRGFRVIEVHPESKEVTIRSIADTGLTTSGGNYDRISDQRVHIADLVRDNKYNVPNEPAHLATRQGGPTEPAALPPAAVKPAISPTQEGAARVATSSPASKAEVRVPPIKPPATKTPPVEATKAPEPSTTAPKDAAMQADRATLGLPELEQVPRVSAAEVLAKAKEANTKDPRAADSLIQQALAGGKNFNNIETMQVNLRAQEAKNRIDALSAEIYKATDPQVIAEKRAEQDALINEVGRISEAQDLAGAEWSRAGTARQRAINQDFDLVSMVVRMKKAKGRDLTADERARIDHQQKRITELETKLAVAQETAKIASLQKQIDRVKRQTKRGETKQVLDEEFAALKQQFATAKIETRSGIQSSGLAGLDPEGKLTVLIAKMARNRVKAGVVEAKKLVDEVYSAISDKVEGLRREDVRDSILAYGFAEGRERTRQTQLLKQEADLSRRLEQGDFSKVVRQPVVYTRETAALQRRIDDIKQQFERERYRATRSSGQKVSDELAKVAGVPKTIKSIGDISAVFRQGGYYAITHPIRGGAIPFRDMIRSFSDAGFRNVEQKIQNYTRDGVNLYEQSVKDGVEYTGVNKDDPRLHLREEGFLGKEYLDYIPVAKQIKNFSERTFVSFLDSQRINMYDVLTDGLANPSALSRLMGARGGLTRNELKADRQRIAKMINSATGRGNLGKKGNQAAPMLNVLMFSPRLVASRVQLLNTMFNPVSWARMPRNARAQILQDNVKFLAATTATLTLMRHLGADVTLDPDDSEFLKIRIGDTTYDTLTGLQQPLRYLLNMTRALSPVDSKTLQTGDYYAGTDPWPMTVGTKTRGGFLESKASPTASAVIESIRGSNFLGRKRSLGSRALDLATPLPAKDVIEGLKQGGLLGALQAVPALTGIGVGSYPPAAEKPVTLADKLARKLSRPPDDKARDEEEVEESFKISELRARSRRGEDVSAELPALNLTDRQQKTITDAKGQTRLQQDFKRLTLENALRVWQVATAQEQAQIKPLLADKADAVDQLDPSKQAAVKAQLRAAGIVPIEELPADKRRDILSKRRLESREQARARREKQRAQGRQRPSAGYGYQ